MIDGKLIVDNFAGGGGASTGIEIATGISVDIAINHDPEAIKMHKMNHPSTKHYCESVWDVKPIEACKGRPVALAWFSPDCKHFSKAKGGKPKDKNIRGLAWVALRWAGTVRPDVIMLENVEEFKTWGPLNRRHRPIKAKQGVTFKKFISQLEELGYTVEYKELVAADYGAPTMRKRFFLIARCDNRTIIWPKPTHAPADSAAVKEGLLKPYVGAYTQLDFSLPCPSIFDTAEEIKEKYGIRAVRPLAPKTMERIARGLKKFVIDNAEPFIVQVNHSGAKSDYCKSANEPLSTVTAKHGFGVIEPYLVQCKYNNEAQDVEKPLGTVTTVGSHLLVEPKLAPIIDKAYGGNYQGNGSSVDKPIDTITTVDHNRLVEAKLMPFMGVNTTNHPGGKDSLFMTDEIIQRNLPLDYVVMFDTEMEFTATYRSVEAIKPKIETYGAKFIVLKNNTHWLEDMLLRTVNEGTSKEHFGYEWCGYGKCRWRTSQKVNIINNFLSELGEYKQYVGIAYDEPDRVKEESFKLYPLVDWKVTEKECLEECWHRGYNWNEPTSATESGYIDLYKILKRVSCWCCANKNLEELYNIYYYLPQYWKKLEALQSRIDRPFRRDGKTIFDLKERFFWQSQQMKIEDFLKQ